MPIATAGGELAIRMDDIDFEGLWEGQITPSATMIRVVTPYGETIEFIGNFQYDASGALAGGTLTGVRSYYNGVLAYEVTGASVPATRFYDWVEAGDTVSALSAIFSGNDTFVGSRFDDYLEGFGGNDILDGGAGSDTLVGGAGDDTYYIDTPTDEIFDTSGYDTAVIDYDFELTGSGAVERYILGENASVAWGANSNDHIEGNARGNILIGRGGADTLLGHDGDDELVGMSGNDFLDGGSGTDIAYYGSVRRNFVANSATVSGAGEGTDTLVSIEILSFTDGWLTFEENSQAAQVMRIYDAALGRQPDQGGFEAWLDQMERGMSLAQIAQAFLGSAEFQANFGGLSNQDYVAQLYRTTLRREADPGGLAVWTAQLDNGLMTRTDVLVAFSESAEHVVNTASVLNQGLWIADDQAKIIARLYDATFDRLPDAGGLNAWTSELRDFRPILEIAEAFASSPEFQQRYGNLSNQDFVAQLYRFTLDREPDPNGLATWTAQLDTGAMTRAQVLLSFSESAEHVELTAHLWLGGIQVLGGSNSAPIEGAKSLVPPEPFLDLVTFDGTDDSDGFVVPAGFQGRSHTSLEYGSKAFDHSASHLETLPTAWFQDAPNDLDVHDAADLALFPQNEQRPDLADLQHYV